MFGGAHIHTTTPSCRHWPPKFSVYQALRPWLSRVELSSCRGSVEGLSRPSLSSSCIEPVRRALAPERVLSARSLHVPDPSPSTRFLLRVQHTNTFSMRSSATIGLFYRDLGARWLHDNSWWRPSKEKNGRKSTGGAIFL